MRTQDHIKQHVGATGPVEPEGLQPDRTVEADRHLRIGDRWAHVDGPPAIKLASSTGAPAFLLRRRVHRKYALQDVGEGIITGIGYIGGGAIIEHGTPVLGTATAASRWATGLSAGLGVYDVAITIGAITFATLWFVVPHKEGGKG